MAYSTATPPVTAVARIGGIAANSTSVYNRAPALWLYNTSDGTTVLQNAGYFSNGKALGMRYGDMLLALSASTESSTGHITAFGALVSTLSSAGWNLSTGGTITSTFT